MDVKTLEFSYMHGHNRKLCIHFGAQFVSFLKIERCTYKYLGFPLSVLCPRKMKHMSTQRCLSSCSEQHNSLELKPGSPPYVHEVGSRYYSSTLEDQHTIMEPNTDICNRQDKPQRRFTKLKKSNTKNYVLYDFIRVKF